MEFPLFHEVGQGNSITLSTPLNGSSPASIHNSEFLSCGCTWQRLEDPDPSHIMLSGLFFLKPFQGGEESKSMDVEVLSLGHMILPSVEMSLMPQAKDCTVERVMPLSEELFTLGQLSLHQVLYRWRRLQPEGGKERKGNPSG